MAKDQVELNFSFKVHMEKDQVEQSFSCTHGEEKNFSCMAKDQVKDHLRRIFPESTRKLNHKIKQLSLNTMAWHAQPHFNQVATPASYYLCPTSTAQILPFCSAILYYFKGSKKNIL